MIAKDLSRFYFRTFALTALAAIASSAVGSRLIFNGTASMPIGFYWLTTREPIARGATVAFPVPANVDGIVRERRYLPEGALLLKPVVAMQGDEVCTAGGVLRVNGALMGGVLDADAAGRTLPHQYTCGPVQEGEVFVASCHPRSFDSRMFGSVPLSAVRGTVRSLWIF